MCYDSYPPSPPRAWWHGIFIPRGWNLFFFFHELQISTPRSLKKPVQFPRYAEIRQNNAKKIAGRTSIPPCGSHPFIVCLSVVRAEITNIFGPKDSRQDTTLLACATMLLSNARNYCPTSGQRVKALRLLRQPQTKLTGSDPARARWCAPLPWQCWQQGAPGQRRQVASAQIGCTCCTCVAPHCQRSVHMQSGAQHDLPHHLRAHRFRA